MSLFSGLPWLPPNMYRARSTTQMPAVVRAGTGACCGSCVASPTHSSLHSICFPTSTDPCVTLSVHKFHIVCHTCCVLRVRWCCVCGVWCVCVLCVLCAYRLGGVA